MNLLTKKLNGVNAIHLPCLSDKLVYKLPYFYLIRSLSKIGNFTIMKIAKINGKAIHSMKNTIVRDELIISPTDPYVI